MENEMIEPVARALHVALAGGDPDELIHHPAQKSWEVPSWRRWEQWEDAARAAIEAMREPLSELMKARQEHYERKAAERDALEDDRVTEHERYAFAAEAIDHAAGVIDAALHAANPVT